MTWRFDADEFYRVGVREGLRYIVGTEPLTVAANEEMPWPPRRRGRSDLELMRLVLTLGLNAEVAALMVIGELEHKALWHFRPGDEHLPEFRQHVLDGADHGFTVAKRTVGIGSAENRVAWKHGIYRTALQLMDGIGMTEPDAQAAVLGVSRRTLFRLRRALSA